MIRLGMRGHGRGWCCVSLGFGRITRLLLVGISLAVVVAACGGGSDNGDSEALTKVEYIAEANALCAEADEASEAAEEQFSEDLEAAFPDGG